MLQRILDNVFDERGVRREQEIANGHIGNALQAKRRYAEMKKDMCEKGHNQKSRI